MKENEDQLRELLKEIIVEKMRSKIQKNKIRKNKLQKNKTRKPKKLPKK